MYAFDVQYVRMNTKRVPVGETECYFLRGKQESRLAAATILNYESLPTANASISDTSFRRIYRGIHHTLNLPLALPSANSDEGRATGAATRLLGAKAWAVPSRVAAAAKVATRNFMMVRVRGGDESIARKCRVLGNSDVCRLVPEGTQYGGQTKMTVPKFVILSQSHSSVPPRDD